jgi:methylase of polypeptide subunit release factors
LATYTLETPPESNLDIKVFGVKKAKKGTIAWAVGLTPNFEDEPFNGKFNVGIDFIIPESLDRVIIALSKNYVIRTLELKGQLTATFLEILNSWMSVTDLSRKVEFHEILWNSLDLSPINKKFYEGISQRFISLRQHIETSGALDHEHAAQFANRLIGRVIFTWFLDKKSLIEPSLKYFESEDYKDDTDYYREKLESLFFEVLNTPVSDRTAKDTSTPYLNGGLFEPKPSDLYKDKTLTFPKNFFDDFLGFLRGYNFTTDESTTEFQQVAIDPEMLGRIFENLLAEVSDETGEQARKAKGAFYTPRQIVDFMCKESLKSYLRQSLGPIPDLDKRLFQLIDASERDFQDQDHNWRRDLRPHSEVILSALNELKVLDPACGSGAFPIGMMQLLVSVQSRLQARFNPYRAKLSIVQNNIFGVDIEPMAVEIARLRAWLAIVVDEDTAEGQVKPLPNLDFKFVCANALVELDSKTQMVLFEDAELDSKLQSLRVEYFGTQNRMKKLKLREKYSELVNQELTLFGESLRTAQLKSFKPFEVDSVSQFFDPIQMFGFSSFDLVIGNPPYIGERGHKLIFEPIRQSALGKRFYQGKMDYFYFFFHRGLDLLKESGILAMITTNYYVTATFASKLVADINDRATPISFVNFNEAKLFESAAGQHNLITILRKGHTNAPVRVTTVKSDLRGKTEGSVLRRVLSGDSSLCMVESIPRDQIISGNQIIISRKKNGALDATLDRMAAVGERLGDLYEVRQGVLTGADKVSKSHVSKYGICEDLVGQGIFVLSHDELKALNLDSHDMEIVRPYFKNSDIKKYGVKTGKHDWLIYADKKSASLESRKTLREHLEGFRVILDQASDNSPYLHRPRGFDFDSEKIVVPQRSSTNTFGYSADPFYASADVYFIGSGTGEISLPALTGILNSRLYFHWLYNRGKRKGEALELFQVPISDIPLPRVTQSTLEPIKEIESLSKRLILSVANDETVESDLVQRIDVLVFGLFGVSESEASLFASGSHGPLEK